MILTAKMGDDFPEAIIDAMFLASSCSSSFGHPNDRSSALLYSSGGIMLLKQRLHKVPSLQADASEKFIIFTATTISHLELEINGNSNYYDQP